MNGFRFLSLACCLCLAAVLGAADLCTTGVPPVPYPLWDGHETIARYARRVNLPETQTLDLGNGVALELVLIPAGKFIMGTPEPKPVDKAAFLRKIIIGQAVLAAGGGILLVLICFAILRAIRERRRFQYSLRRLIAMTFAAGLCVLGAMHWWHSRRSLEEARGQYSVALARFKDAYREYTYYYWEVPAHEVTITKPFYMAKYKVTQEQYQQIMGVNPSHFQGLDLPVEMVSWDDAKEFCKKGRDVTRRQRAEQRLPGSSEASGLADARGSEFRLPTDAEREYACRAGTITKYHSGDRESDLARVAWYRPRDSPQPHLHPVGQKEPNAWGLYDMHGNLWEWCEDDFHTVYAGAPTAGPARDKLPSGSSRVLRGGSWGDYPRFCRSAIAHVSAPHARTYFFGFRVVLAGPP